MSSVNDVLDGFLESKKKMDELEQAVMAASSLVKWAEALRSWAAEPGSIKISRIGEHDLTRTSVLLRLTERAGDRASKPSELIADLMMMSDDFLAGLADLFAQEAGRVARRIEDAT